MGERLRVVGGLILALCLPLSAQAGELDDGLTEVRTLIGAGEHKEALKSLKAIEKSLGSADVVLSPRSLARVWFYKGAAEFGAGNKKGRAEDAWRQALTVQNDFPWDVDLLGETDLISLFEALRGEVEGRGYVDTGVPEKVGLATLYVDGIQHGPEETVIRGVHLAQIECPDDQGVFSQMTDFSKPLAWFALCPDGVDTSVEVAMVEEDEWAEFGPTFGTPAVTDTVPDEATSEPVVAVEPDEPEPPPEAPVADVEPDEPTVEPDAPAEDPVAESDQDEPTEPAAAASQDEASIPSEPAATGSSPNVIGMGTYILASGGALVAGGLVVNFAVVNPTYSAIEDANADPYSIQRSEASDLTSRFNTARYLTIGLTTGGMALIGSSFLIDAPLQPIFGLGHLGLSGRF